MKRAKTVLAIAAIAAVAIAGVLVLRRPAATAKHSDDVAHLAARGELDDAGATRAAAAIAHIRDPHAVPELVALAHNDQRAVIVRANALRALAAIGTDARWTAQVRDLVEDPHAPIRVRVEAALALRQLGRASDVAALGTLLDDAALDQQLRLAIVQALAAIGGPAGDVLAREDGRADATERAFLHAKKP